MALIAAFVLGHAIQQVAVPDLGFGYGQPFQDASTEPLQDFSKFCIKGYEIDSQYWRPAVLDASGKTRLAIQHDGTFEELSAIDQLVGRVSIKTTDDALALVRLLTAPRTSLYFGSFWNEVVPLSSWNKNHIHADPLVAEFVVHFSNDSVSWGGAASDAVLEKIHYHRPVVTKEFAGNSATFIIDRFIIEGPLEHEANVYEITERVGADGKYQLLSKSAIDSNGIHRWMLAPPAGIG